MEALTELPLSVGVTLRNADQILLTTGKVYSIIYGNGDYSTPYTGTFIGFKKIAEGQVPTVYFTSGPYSEIGLLITFIKEIKEVV